MLGKKHNAAGETAVEKPLRGKVQNQTFPPSLPIAQKARDSHFPTAAGRVFGYISNVSTVEPRVTSLNGLTRVVKQFSSGAP